MINLYIAVNNYSFVQGINSVVDQYLKNTSRFESNDVNIAGVIDCNTIYHDIPDRDKEIQKTINSSIKKRSMYNSLLGNAAAILAHYFYIGYKVAKNVNKYTLIEDPIIFQDVFAAYYALKLYGNQNVIFMTHTYEDELEQLLMNYPYIKNHKIERKIRKIYRYVYEYSKKTIVICKKAKMWVSNMNPNATIDVIYNSVDDIPVKLIEHGSDVINIAMASSIGIRKGFDILAEALIELPQEILKKCKFHIYGDGDYLDTIKEMCKRHKIDNITFYGRCKSPFLNYSEIDAYLMVSRSETLPMGIIEAMMCGLPIFSTNVGAVSELVKNGENGYLYNPDKESICKAIADIVHNQEQLRAMGIQSRLFYENKFSGVHWVEQMACAIK